MSLSETICRNIVTSRDQCDRTPQRSLKSQGTQPKVNGGAALPYPVTGATVAPAALHLAKSSDAALLAAEAAARPVDEFHARLWVDGEMQEEAHHLPVC